MGRFRWSRWVPAVVLGCLLATFLNGLVVGYGVIWFQLFGDRPDREDYLMSFGGYAAAALVLLVGLLSLVRLRIASWAIVLVGVVGGVLVLLAINSLSTGLGMEEGFGPSQHWWDGAGGVLFFPWAWVPLALGVLAAVGRGPRRSA